MPTQETTTDDATADLSENYTIQHKWPWRLSELAIVGFCIAVPLVTWLVFGWSLPIVGGIGAVLALLLIRLGWSRKRRSLIQVTMTDSELTVYWPHTTVQKRADPTSLDLAKLTGISRGPDHELGRMLIVYSGAKRAYIPQRVQTPQLALRLLEAADKIGVTNTSVAYDEETNVSSDDATGETGATEVAPPVDSRVVVISKDTMDYLKDLIGDDVDEQTDPEA
jgi:hypothetical protein